MIPTINKKEKLPAISPWFLLTIKDEVPKLHLNIIKQKFERHESTFISRECSFVTSIKTRN